MAGVNKVIILGNLGKDPEVRFIPNGGAVANLTIATSESWKDKQTGESKEKTEWHRVVMFARLAEIAGEYLKKGSKVYIEGALQTRKWQNQQGQDQYTTEIVVQDFNGTMQMLGNRNQNGGQQTGGYSQSMHQQAPQQQGGYSQQGQQQQGGFQHKPAQQQYSKPHQQQGGFTQQSPQQSGFQQQNAQLHNEPDRTSRLNQPKVNPQVPVLEFDDDIPFQNPYAHPMMHLVI